MVFTWVDGDDPVHRAKRASYKAPSRHVRDTSGETRFRSVGEIDYAVLSVLRFAPFVRRIHIVTDNQIPPIARAAAACGLGERIKVVDHSAVFRGHEAVLPTFNARSIETVLHRVPGLAEHHVYFNDDMLLIKPLAPEHWFIDGQPVLRGHWAQPMDTELSQRLRAWLRKLVGRTQHRRPHNRRSQALAASMLGHGQQYYWIHHVPTPLRRSTVERIFAEHPEWMLANLPYRFRDGAQFNTSALAAHAEIQAGQVQLDPDTHRCYIETAGMTAAALTAELGRAESDPQTLFVCLQNLDEALPEGRQAVLQWLDRVIGSPADLAAWAPSPTIPG